MDSDGIKIVRGDDAPCCDLGPVTNAQGSAHDFAHNKGVNQRTTSLQIQEIRPGSQIGLLKGRSGKCKELLLMNHRRVGTEQYSLDPAKDGNIRAYTQGQAENGQKREAW